MVFGALGVTGFGGNEWGRLLRLSPRHPRYLVSLPTRPARFSEESDVRLDLRDGEGVKYRNVGLTQG